MYVEGFCCRTNLPSSTAFRGFGAPQAMMAIETVMEHAAKAFQFPVDKLRYDHFLKQNQKTFYGQELKYCYLQKLWDDVLHSSDYENAKKAVTQFNNENKWKKRGIAVIPSMYGVCFPITVLNQGGADVIVYDDGSVLVSHGGTEMGQGLNTKVVQIVAQAFQIETNQIYIAECASDRVPNTSPTAASVGSDINGMAALDACEQINVRLEPIRKKLGPNASWKQVILAAYNDRINLAARGYYKTPQGGEFNWKMDTKDHSQRGQMWNYFTFGICCSLVEVNLLSGKFEMLRSDLIMDVGKSLNPAIDIGQVEGAFIQGMGWWTIETHRWNDGSKPWMSAWTPLGTLYSNTPRSYVIPRVDNVPLDFRVSLLAGSCNPNAVHSSKAVGEPPIFLSASVYFAIKDALYHARAAHDVHEFIPCDSPLSFESIRLWSLDPLAKKYT